MWVMSKILRRFLRSFRASSSCIVCGLGFDELSPSGVVERVGDGEDVFVAAPRLVDEHRLVAAEASHLFERLCEGVGRLERGDQPFLLDRQRRLRLGWP